MPHERNSKAVSNESEGMMGEAIKCDKCDGTGWILRREPNGHTYAQECECIARRKVANMLRNSGVDIAEYSSKTLDTFVADDDNSKAMKELAERFLADPDAKGIGYFGKSGTGKTHICIAICQELTLNRHEPHYYFAYRKEIQALKAAYYDAERYSDLTNHWSTCQNLYIDDLFKFATNKDGTMQTQDLQIMFEIINNRYLHKLKTLISSEYTIKELMTIDAALASRIYEMVKDYAMKCDGTNRRMAK